jgi:hypothetical protein
MGEKSITIVRAVTADFFFGCRAGEVPSDGLHVFKLSYADYLFEGPKESYVIPKNTHLACACALIKHRKRYVFLPTHPRRGLWATCIRLSDAKAEREFPTP